MSTTSDLSPGSPAAAAAAAGLLCHGVMWPDRRPHLAGTDTATGRPVLVPLLGERVGFVAAGGGRRCTGHTVLTGPAKGHRPCRDHLPAVTGGQCERCSARDEFRFAHQFHRGGYATDGLRQYMNQPHRLYIATFADGTSKVGTASASRQHERLDEQGPALATYIATAPDGAAVRVLEDAVSAHLRVVQVKSKAAKVAALSHPAAWADVAVAHERTVRLASDLLTGSCSTAPVDVTALAWEPPPATVPVLAGVRDGGWPAYPHDVRVGAHGIHVDAVAGSVVVGRLDPGTDSTACVVDLSALRGHVVQLGNHQSAPTSFQTSLF